jgi:AAHS family benzoate transporter-like MFS transporter
LASPFAPNVAVFSLLRLLAGLGLGACLPAALAYMNDYAPAGSAGKSTTRTMTGYHVGAVATAFLAILIVPNWRLMFIIGGAAGLVLLPFLWIKLPESLPEAAPAAGGQKPARRQLNARTRNRTADAHSTRQAKDGLPRPLAEAVSPGCRWVLASLHSWGCCWSTG